MKHYKHTHVNMTVNVSFEASFQLSYIKCDDFGSITIKNTVEISILCWCKIFWAQLTLNGKTVSVFKFGSKVSQNIITVVSENDTTGKTFCIWLEWHLYTTMYYLYMYI